MEDRILLFLSQMRTNATAFFKRSLANIRVADGLWSTAVFRIRQAIESLFNRIRGPVATKKTDLYKV